MVMLHINNFVENLKKYAIGKCSTMAMSLPDHHSNAVLAIKNYSILMLMKILDNPEISMNYTETKDEDFLDIQDSFLGNAALMVVQDGATELQRVIAQYMVVCLFKRGADLKGEYENPESLLISAAKERSLPLVKILCCAGAVDGVSDYDHATPLQKALFSAALATTDEEKKESAEIVEYLLGYGSDPLLIKDPPEDPDEDDLPAPQVAQLKAMQNAQRAWNARKFLSFLRNGRARFVVSNGCDGGSCFPVATQSPMGAAAAAAADADSDVEEIDVREDGRDRKKRRITSSSGGAGATAMLVAACPGLQENATSGGAGGVWGCPVCNHVNSPDKGQCQRGAKK